MTDRDTQDLARVEALLDEVRDTTPPLMSAALTAKLIAQAQATQDASVVTQKPRAAWRDWMADLGGWRGVGGLVTAGVAGLWLGIAPSAAAEDLWASIAGESYDVAVLGEWDVFDVESDG